MVLKVISSKLEIKNHKSQIDHTARKAEQNQIVISKSDRKVIKHFLNDQYKRQNMLNLNYKTTTSASDCTVVQKR